MWVIGFILGIILGSLVKALADRSLANESFLGRSYCPKCKHKLHWYDLFPILSFISTSGKCRYCHKKIGVGYPLVEIVMGILTGFLFWQSFQSSALIFDLIFKTFFITILATLFLTDIREMFIPDRIILPSIVISIIFLIIITAIKGRGLTAEPLLSSVLMGLLIGGFFMALIIVTRGKGMGGGDVKLGAFMGLGLGFPGSLIALIIAFLSGAIVSLILIISGKKHFGQVIPFGPFLVLGSLAVLFWGNQILNWYLRLGA